MSSDGNITEGTERDFGPKPTCSVCGIQVNGMLLTGGDIKWSPCEHSVTLEQEREEEERRQASYNTPPGPDDVIIITEEEYKESAKRVLTKLGTTYHELQSMSRHGDYPTDAHRRTWLALINCPDDDCSLCDV